jgi:hypothetical protein
MRPKKLRYLLETRRNYRAEVEKGRISLLGFGMKLLTPQPTRYGMLILGK